MERFYICCMSYFFVKDLEPEAFPTVRTSTTIEEVLNLFRDYKVSHLAVVNNEEYLGLIEENEVLLYKKSKQPIGALPLHVITVSGKLSDHILDLLFLSVTHKLSILPIVDEKKHFIKYCTVNTLVKALSELLSVQYPGAILVLEVPIRSYSLAHISSIIEENNAHVLSVMVNTFPDSTLMHVIIKIDRQDVSFILNNFERYHYKVVAYIGEDLNQDILEERYNLLIKFLNI